MKKIVALSTAFSLALIAGVSAADAQPEVARVIETTTIIVQPSSSELRSTPVSTSDVHSPAEIASMPVNGDALPAPRRLGTDERPGVRVFQNGREYWDPENNGGVNPTRNLPRQRDITNR